MITKDNIRELLQSLEFVTDSTSTNDILIRRFHESDTQISVDFSTHQIIYPKDIKIERATTINFSDNENFVVLACVCQLLNIGYLPSNIVLEPKTPGGREDGNYYGDILIRDNDEIPFMLIECKTAGSEYEKEWHKMLREGGQLFRYYNSYRQAQYICLYTSDFIDGRTRSSYRIIKMTDNQSRISSDKDLVSYASVTSKGGDYREYFNVWKDTYECDYLDRGGFEHKFTVRENAYDAMSDLRAVDSEEIKKIYNEFAVILRQHNVGSHENAFDKLVNLFLAKVVDEINNPNDLHFYWKGTSYDDDFSLQDRLQRLYRDGMKKFLGEEVTYIENSEIDKAFRWVVNDVDATKKTIKEYFRALKFFSDNDFAFLSVHNKRLFKQNAIVLQKVVKMLQGIRLRTSEIYQNQLLGDLFEGFLNKGVKQSEGQYFTPMPIVRFLVSSLPLENVIERSPDIPKAIDYACGAGHFLTEYAIQIKPYISKRKPASLLDYYANIYGIEKEYRLSKVAKVAAFMYGHDEINIIHADALSKIDSIQDNSFSVLVANPPYSVAGFLETLTPHLRKEYELFSDNLNIDKNKAIEAFFIERAAKLLKKDGVAAIVLPSSILNKTGIYESARNILIRSFDIVGISEFSSNTFGKTPTSTVALFLRRKETITPDSEHFLNRVNAWFSQNNTADEIYDDLSDVEEYCEHCGYKYEDYVEFMKGSMNDSFYSSRMVKEYVDSFDSNSSSAMNGVNENAKTIRKKFKERLSQTSFKRLSQEEQRSIKRDAILNFIREIEKEKLYFFLIISNNRGSVIIARSPTGNSDAKKYLGYEWSDSRGKEGIQYLHMKKASNSEEDVEDDTINQIRGIQGIQTPLFNPDNLFDAEKINSIIRSNFLGEEIHIPESLEPYLTETSLVDLIDFSLTSFTKEIKTTPVESNIPLSKFPLVRVQQLLGRIDGATTKIESSQILPTGNYPVISQDSKQYISGYYNSNPITDLPLILFGDHSCVIKYVDSPFVRGADGIQLIKCKSDKIQLKYLYYYLRTIKLPNAHRYERHYKYLKRLYIPLPDQDTQTAIIRECDNIKDNSNEKISKIVNNYII